VGNIKSGKKRLKKYPFTDFAPQAVALMDEPDLLLIYGVRTSQVGSGFLIPNSDRTLLFYDLKEQKFFGQNISFPHKKYNFDAYSNPSIEVRNDFLIIQHPRSIEIYRYSIASSR
jgi:hypothetical protein